MYSVSVILPIYNNEKTLKKSIDSILNQSLYAIELILINNGSTDSSAQICDDFVKKEPLLVEVIHQEHVEMAQVMNTGLYHSHGSFVYFGDPTTIYDKSFLFENAKLAVKKKADLVVFGFTANIPTVKGQVQSILPRMPYIEDKDQFRRHFRNYYHFYPYDLFNKIYRRNYLIENRVHFNNIPFNYEKLFNLNVLLEMEKVVFNRKAYFYVGDKKSDAHIQYSDNKFRLSIEIAKQFDSMIKYWGYEEEFADLVAEEYFNVIYYELLAISTQRSSLSKHQKQDEIDLIIHDNKLQQLIPDLKHLEIIDPLKTELIRLIKKRNASDILRLLSSSKIKKKLTFKTVLKKVFKLN